MKRKLYFLAVALVLTVLLLPQLGLEARAETYSGTCGNDLTWTLDTDTGLLTISGTGPMESWYSTSSVPWRNYSGYITSVVVEEGGTTLSFGAFYYNSNIQSVSLPSTLTYIEDRAFQSCSSLTSLQLPAGLTQLGNYAFYGCRNLQSVNLPQGLTSLSSYVFYNCAALTGVELPSGLRAIYANAFYGCASLGSLTIPEGCSTIGASAFFGSGLTSVSIPASVTSIGTGAFAGTASLTSFTVAADSSNYSAPEGVLFNKTGTTLLQYPAGRPGTYTVPNGTASIAAGAFEGSAGLTALTLNPDLANVGAGAFRGCAALTALTFPQGVTSIPSEVCRNCGALAEVTFPENVASLGASAFLGCTSLDTLTVRNPDCVFPAGSLVPASTTIQGYMVSTAHDYADAQGLPFDPIDGCDYGVHVYALAEQVHRTEDTDGYRLFRCQRCGAEYTDPFPAWNNYAPLSDRVVALPQPLMGTGTEGAAEQYYSESQQGLYFREGDALYCWYPRSGELYLSHTFLDGSLYYRTGELLYALNGTKVTVYDLAEMDVARTLRLPQAYAFTAIGVDGQGRIYTAGKAESGSVASIYLYDAEGALLSEVPLGNRAPVRCFVGFDDQAGRFFLEGKGNYQLWYSTSGNHPYYTGYNLSCGLVEDGLLSLETYSSIFRMVGYYYKVDGLSFTLADGHWRSEELLENGTVMCVSSFTGERRILDPTSLTDYWSLPYLAADDDGQGGSLPSTGTRSVCLPQRGTLLCYDGNRMLREYDPDTHEVLSFFQTAHPVYSLFRMGDRAAALETDGSTYYLELIDWSTPTELTVSPVALTMTVGQETAAFTVTVNRSFTEDFIWSSADPGIVFPAGQKTMVATNPGVTRVFVTPRNGGPTASVTIQVVDKPTLPTGSATAADATFNNQGLHTYTSAWSRPVRSYLTENPDGTLERVCYDADNGVTCSVHAADGTELSRQTLPPELSIFGGCFRGADGLRYLVFGQSNPEESDEREVLRVVQYDADWTRLNACSVYGANTYIPFDAGSLRMTEAAGKLYIHTCHEMYASSDGLHHQANMTFILDEATLTLITGRYSVSNFSTGYVSHSFNQFILAEGDRIYRVDHGDAYPRALCVTLTPVGDTLTPTATNNAAFPIRGNSGANATGVSLGALACSETDVLFAGNSVDQSPSGTYSAYGQRNIFVVANRADLSTAETHWFTDYAADDGVTPGTPYLVRIAPNQFLLLWEEYRSADRSYSVTALRVNADGTAASARYQLPNMRMSDCEPILCANGTVCWYVSDGSAMTFYRLDPYHLNAWPGSSSPDYPFLDVQDPGDYYFTPVYWAMAHDPQITSGTDETHFSPARTCTREQIVTFLWHAMGDPAPLMEVSLFTDMTERSYFKNAVRWAVSCGVSSGVGDGMFGVGQGCTRAQAVTFLWKALGAPEPAATETDFTDVPADRYYYRAVLWAVENGITAGTSATTFSPNDVCTRAQIVTFLYKAINGQ